MGFVYIAREREGTRFNHSQHQPPTKVSVLADAYSLITVSKHDCLALLIAAYLRVTVSSSYGKTQYYLSQHGVLVRRQLLLGLRKHDYIQKIGTKPNAD